MSDETLHHAKRERVVLVIGTSARGGIRSVIQAYEEVGFYRAYPYRFVETHTEGSLAKRLWVAARGLVTVFWLLLMRQVLLIHAHASMRGSFWRKGIMCLLARLFGRPFILHLHGSEFRTFYDKLGWLGQALVKQVLQSATAVVVLSDYWRDFIGTICPANPVVVPNFVLDRYGHLPVTEARKHVLFLGQIGTRKGAFDLLTAMAIAREACSGVKLLMAGNGQVAEAREQVEQLGLSGIVEVVGWVDGVQKDRLIAEAGIFVLPSHNEGLPMAIIEAMNAGMAVLSTPVGSIPEVIAPEENGLLVEPGRPPKLANALTSLLVDPSRRLAIAARGRETYHRLYCPEVAVGAMESLYRQVLEAV